MRKILGFFVGIVLFPSAAFAEAPQFDRPGIAFAPGVLPPETFDWEQGLPDFQRDRVGDMRTSFYTADTTLRFGLDHNLEAQVGGSLWNRLDVSTPGIATRTEGAGDTKLSLKWAPPSFNDHVSFAVLGGVTLDSGAQSFTNGRRVYSFGAVVARDLAGSRSVAAYANVDRSGGRNTWTLSTNYGFPLHGNFGGFVEAARVFGNGASSTLAGAGGTWLWNNQVQLDVSARRGLTSRSPDLQAGFGVSVFWK